MDLIGPLSDSLGFTYVVTFIDHFSNWEIAVPTTNKKQYTAAAVLVNEVICRYGCPRVLLSDNGMEFNNAMITEVFAMLQIKKIYSLAYHPESNGKVERFNGTLKHTSHTHRLTRHAVE